MEGNMDYEMPDINFVTEDGPASESVTSEDEGFDPSVMKAVLVRTFAHDITSCDETRELLTALGMTHGSDEGYELDHMASHRRIGNVGPLEALLRVYSDILGTVVSTALTEGHGVAKDMTEEHSIVFAEQNTMVVLAATRAILAQLLSKGVLCYGPGSVHLIQVVPGE